MGYNYELRLYVATSPDGDKKKSKTEWYSGTEKGARSKAIKLLKGAKLLKGTFKDIPIYVEIHLAGCIYKGAVLIRDNGRHEFDWDPAVGKRVPLNENGTIKEDDAWHPFGL
ncbi:MAG: hypothetical protein IIY21_08625 [Clostridiales bacterium]|nr:hypothetical protein [Clostridiales bacterium]